MGGRSTELCYKYTICLELFKEEKLISPRQDKNEYCMNNGLVFEQVATVVRIELNDGRIKVYFQHGKFINFQKILTN